MFKSLFSTTKCDVCSQPIEPGRLFCKYCGRGRGGNKYFQLKQWEFFFVVVALMLCLMILCAGIIGVIMINAPDQEITIEAKQTLLPQPASTYYLSDTPSPSLTPQITETPQPTQTPLPTNTILPTITFTPTPPFAVRPYNKTTDSSAKCVWCRVDNLEWPKSPGRYSWQVDFPLGIPAVLEMGWCTLDQATLDSNLPLMNYDLVVDGYEISHSLLAIKETQDTDYYCHSFIGVLQGWGEGRHTYIWIQRINTSLFDGWDVYSEGSYEFEFIVTVK